MCAVTTIERFELRDESGREEQGCVVLAIASVCAHCEGAGVASGIGCELFDRVELPKWDVIFVDEEARVFSITVVGRSA